MDFNCLNLTIEDNVMHPFIGSQHGIFFQNPLRSGGIATIGRNTLARKAGFAHILLGGTNLPKQSKLTGSHPPTAPVGQIAPGILYKVFVPSGPSGSITYGGVTYNHGATFTGSPSFTYFQTTGAAQVRHASDTPPVSLYTVKIGTSQANKNTYKLGSTTENEGFNRFLYYRPGDNSVPNILEDPIATEATPPNSPKDGVSVQDY